MEKKNQLKQNISRFNQFLIQLNQKGIVRKKEIEQIKDVYEEIVQSLNQNLDLKQNLRDELFIMNFQYFEAVKNYLNDSKNLKDISNQFDLLDQISEASLNFDEGELSDSKNFQMSKSISTFYEKIFEMSQRIKDSSINYSKYSSNADFNNSTF